MIFGKRAAAQQQPNPPRPVRVMANGHDVTDKMPLTAAELTRQQPNPPREALVSSPANKQYQAGRNAETRAAAESMAPAYVQTNNDPFKLGGPVPPSLGRTADLYRDIREVRLAMEKETKEVQARETELREYLINNLSKSDDTGAAGLRYRAQIVMKDVPRAADWPSIHGFVQKTGRFDLLQKRLGEKAVMDMVADGQLIPGVEIVHIPDVSITKI